MWICLLYQDMLFLCVTKVLAAAVHWCIWWQSSVTLSPEQFQAVSACNETGVTFVTSCAGALSSLLVPSVFGKPIGRSGGASPASQDTRGTIPALPIRPDSQAAMASPATLGQAKLGRYRSGTSPLVSATSGRPMQWGFSNAGAAAAAAAAADRPKQTFELPTLARGTAGSLGVNRGGLGTGLGRPQHLPAQQMPQMPTSNLSSYNSRQLFGRQY